MGRINVLDFSLANLIAAGEVVDRPASVLKELLENAIDAGATRVTAEVRRGGVSLIRVSDNGCGMPPDDLPVSIRRHATSKIHCAEDLAAISTLGFRGEALAAIAAVSELHIITKTEEAPSGTLLAATAGSVTDLSEVGASNGTTVVVENLFGNVPARRKFLKKDATETMASTAVVEKIAMSRPDIAFEWITDGISRFRTAGDGNLLHTLYALLGRDFAKRLLPVEGENGGVRVHGFIGTPDNARNNRNYQNFFINGRYVKSKTILAALEKAYTSYMAPERFPVAALFLELHPAAVDVNVHPAKLEVKFSDERLIFETVYYAVRSALEKDVSRPELQLSGTRQAKNPLTAFVPIGDDTRVRQMSAANLFPASAPAVAPAAAPSGTSVSRPGTPAEGNSSGKETVPPAPQAVSASAAPAAAREAAIPSGGTPSVREALARLHGFYEESRGAGDAPTVPFSGGQGALSLASDATLLTEEDEGSPAAPVMSAAPAWDSPVDGSGTVSAAASEKESPALAPESAPAPEQPIADDTALSDALPYRIIGEAFRCYLLVEREKELLLIDKHAAHERILFEELNERRKRDGRIGSQQLMVPLFVALGEEELAVAEDDRAELEGVGFAFSLSAGKRGAVLSAVPDAIRLPDAEDLFARMVCELTEGAGNPAVTEEMRRERALYQVACKAAIKGGRVYGEAQIAWLVSRVMALPDITVCPHGRPIAIRLTKNQLDRQFDRIM